MKGTMLKIIKLKTWSLFILLIFISCQKSETKKLTLPLLFSDHMVLQQNEVVAFWGEYLPNEKVSVTGSWGKEISTVSDESGNWKLQLPTPPAGGPFEVSILTSDTTIIFNDVLIGEVWLASGQSNMEMPVTGYLPNENIDNDLEEIAAADYPEIRMFTVKKQLSLIKQKEMMGSWEVCSPEAVGQFSASAYFFARKLYLDLNIPIGIIHSSWGGTVVEAWTSKEGLSDFPELIKPTQQYDETKIRAWRDQFEKLTVTPTPPSFESLELMDLSQEEISDLQFDDAQWIKMNLPAENGYTDVFLPDLGYSQEINGIFWYRKTVILDHIDMDYELKIGAIDDGDITYINGEKVGATLGWRDQRVYKVPKEILNKGENVIAIMHIDYTDKSSVIGPIYLENVQGDKVFLEGSWSGLLYADLLNSELIIYGLKHRDQLSQRPFLYSGGPNDNPSSLFNAMIHPLIPYNIKGVIWYQGEENVARAEQYEKLFPALITDWRSYWGHDFPFYFVQIAPFNYGFENNRSPALRDAQRKSLKVINTGMAITMDIGSPTTIHPSNKQDVGDRLARLALANDYNRDILASGPLYKSHSVKEGKVVIDFTYGQRLMSHKSSLTGFELAGEDQIYVSAEAKIINDQVIAWSDLVFDPKYVRYGWRDYFEGTLFNGGGLPAASFSSQ